MIENQGIHNLYFSNTVTFTLTHIREQKHQQQILLQKSTKLNIDILTVYETSETQSEERNYLCVPSNANNL